MGVSGKIVEAPDELAQPVIIPAGAYVSRAYVRAERDRLWRKTWLQAGRVEDIPNPGDFITYEVMDDSVIILRGDDGAIRAFHNVCPHRGRQLVSIPDGVHDVRGKGRTNFICGFHGWTFNSEGENTYLLDPQDWQHKLTPDMTCLSTVKVGVWAGFLYINMDPDCVSLKESMVRCGEILDHFEFDKMRYKWRQ